MRSKKNKRGSCAVYQFPYFKDDPSFLRLFLLRLLFACVLSGAGAECFPSLLGAELSAGTAAMAAALSCAVFTVLLSQFRRLYVGLFLLCASGIFAFLARDAIGTWAGDFVNFTVKACDGHFLRASRLVDVNAEYDPTPFLIIICVLFGVLTAFSAYGKFHPEGVAAVFILMLVPGFLSERARYLSPMAAFLAAMAALSSMSETRTLNASLAMSGSADCNYAERQYRRGAAKLPPRKKMRSDSFHYGKYLSQGVSVFVIFALIISTVSWCFPRDGRIRAQDLLDGLAKVGEWFSDVTSGFGAMNSHGFFSADGGSINLSNDIYLNSYDKNTETIVEAVTQTTDRIYLRGDVGVDFKGDGWSSLSEIDLGGETYRIGGKTYPNAKDAIDDYAPEIQYYLTRQSIINNGYGASDYVGMQTVKIKYVERMNTLLMPGTPCVYNFRENENFSVKGDFVLLSDKDKIKSMESIVLYQIQTPYAISTAAGGGRTVWEDFFPVDMETYNKDIEDYEHFVQDLYGRDLEAYYYDKDGNLTENEFAEEKENIKYFFGELYRYWKNIVDDDLGLNGGYGPEYEHIRLLFELFEEYNYDDYYHTENFMGYLTDLGTNGQIIAADMIMSYLQSGYFSYSTETDNSEGEYTYLGNFLRETKSGHCALFATTMCLALREIGIPARYVTGFAVGGEPDYTDPDGYHYSLSKRNLHAWVEVYIDGLGWTTFDPTPSDYMDNAGGEDSEGTRTYTSPAETEVSETSHTTRETTAATETSGTSAATTATNKETDISDGNGGGGNSINLKMILICAACVLGAVIIALGIAGALKRLKRKEHTKLKFFRNGEPAGAVGEMLGFILKILSLMKIERKEGETPSDFARRADKALDEFDLVESVIPLLERSEFDKEPRFTDEERKEVYGCAKKLLDMLLGGAKSPKRLVYRIRLFGKGK